MQTHIPDPDTHSVEGADLVWAELPGTWYWNTLDLLLAAQVAAIFTMGHTMKRSLKKTGREEEKRGRRQEENRREEEENIGQER